MTAENDASDALDEFHALLRNTHGVSDEDREADAVARRRRIRRGLIITTVAVAVLLAAIGGYVGWALSASVSAATVTPVTPQVVARPAAAVALPASGAAAVSVSGADDYLGADASDIWAVAGADEVRPMASISKLITALVVLQAHPLASTDDQGPTITFDKADHDLYDAYYVLGATIAPMPTGTTLSEQDALATMLIPSASNYAEAISTWAFGSQSAFLRAARTWLADNGLNSTTMVEPTGIDARNTSTVGDLITLGKIAAADPVIAKITATRSVTISGPGTLTNTNDLLGSHGITGLKTGNLGEDAYNLLFTASVNVGTATPLSVTGVVLGQPSHEELDQAVEDLLDSLTGGFVSATVASGGQNVGTISTPWGSSAHLVVSDDVSMLTWSDTPISAVIDLSPAASYDDGQVVGTITWTAGPNTSTANVEVNGSVEPPGIWWRLTHPSELG